MSCTICNQAEPQAGAVTVTLERDGAIFVMKDVPALLCPNCGEEYVSERVSARVLKLAEQAFDEGVKLDVRHYAGAV